MRQKREVNFSGVHDKHKEWGCLIFDYLGRPLNRFLAKYTSVTPNQVSLLSLILAIVAAYFLILGGYRNILIGASIAFVANIFDMVGVCTGGWTGKLSSPRARHAGYIELSYPLFNYSFLQKRDYW